MLHGLGSNGEDLESLVPYLKPELPDSEFFSPNGIENCDLFPFGYQWFSLANRNEDVMRNELERVSSTIELMISKKAQSLNLSLSDVILFGFSQGTMTSLYLSLSAKNPYKAVVGFSGSLIAPSKISQKSTPVCLIHGLDDEVVPASSLEKAKTILEQENIKVKTALYKNLAHSIDMRGLKTAVEFIKEVTK